MSATLNISLAVVILIFTLIICYWVFPHNILKASKKPRSNNSKNSSSFPQLPPGPKPWPVLGCLPQMIMKTRNMPKFRWVNKVMEEMNTEIACISLGKVHVIPITSPELACEILIKKDSLFIARPDECACAHIISDGYLTTAISTNGDHWKKMRRLVTSHVLSPAAYSWLHDKRIEEANNLIRHVYDLCSTGPLVNVRSVSRHYCVSLMKKMVFNKSLFGNGSENDHGDSREDEIEHLDACFLLLDYLYAFSISDYLPSWLKKLDIDGHQKKVRRALSCVKKYHDREVDARINMWNDGIKNTQEDILDIFVNLKDNEGKSLLTAEEIKAESIELMMAIVDNPSNAVEWAIAEMLNQPMTLERAKAEIESIVGREQLVQECHLPKLNYVKACLKEAFRLHPVAPFNLPHVALTDTIIGNKYFIPKGSHVIVSRQGLGRNSRVWEDPLSFKPERHLMINNKDHVVVLQDPALRMFTFGAGRRGCPASLLGSDLTTMLFARLLQGFNWSLPPDLQQIELIEAKDNMFLSQPLMALAEPRLRNDLYPR